MDPFVRRLIQRLTDPRGALSRNRHFHTFESAEGRVALKTARRLKALRQDILACLAEGRTAAVSREVDGEGRCRVEIRLDRIRGTRVSMLDEPEVELLAEMPGMSAALSGWPAPRPAASSPARSARARERTER